MYRLRITLVGLFALALGACGGNNPQTDEFVAATPDVDGLMLEIGDGSTIHPTLDVGSSLESQATPAVVTPCEPYMYLCNIHAALSGLNSYVRTAIAPIEALARTTPTEVSPTIRVYGPVDAPAAPAVPVASFRLTVKKGLVGSTGSSKANRSTRQTMSTSSSPAEPSGALLVTGSTAGGVT